MDITILTYGSRGDVEPFLALAAGLIHNNHRVTLAAPGKYRDLPRDPAVDYFSLTGDPDRLVADFRDKAGGHPLKLFSAMARHVLPIAGQVFDECQQAVQGADAVLHSFVMTDGGHTLATRVGAASVSVQFFPVFSPTTEFPALTIPDLPLGPGYRRLTHKVQTGLFRWGGRLMYRLIRLQERSLPRLVEWPFSPGNGVEVPILYAFSPEVVPRPHDWGDRAEITGWWQREHDPGWEPPATVRDFLTQPQRKLYIGLGSLLPEPDRELLEVFLRVVESFDLAACIAAEPGENQPVHLGNHSLLVGDLPHGWLFPRMDAVIHHGGAGTTGAVIRSGTPGLVLPASADQFFWGSRVAELGVGPRPIPFRTVSEENLASAVEEMINDRTMQSRAEQLGRAVRQEQGVSQAVASIERFCRQLEQGDGWTASESGEAAGD